MVGRHDRTAALPYAAPHSFVLFVLFFFFGHIMCRKNLRWIFVRLRFEHRSRRETGHLKLYGLVSFSKISQNGHKKKRKFPLCGAVAKIVEIFSCEGISKGMLQRSV